MNSIYKSIEYLIKKIKQPAEPAFWGAEKAREAGRVTAFIRTGDGRSSGQTKNAIRRNASAFLVC